MAIKDESGEAYRRLMAATVYQAWKDLTDPDFIIALDAFLWLTDPGGGPAWLDALDLEKTVTDIIKIIAGGGLDHAKNYNRRGFIAQRGEGIDPLSGDEI